ncbi:MAG: hypothetical protein WCO68_03850 [Verrucomicrobiota bacterium]
MKSFLTSLAATVLLATSAFASLDYTYTGVGLADGSGQITITYPTNYTGGSHSESGIYVGQLDMRNPLDGSTFNAFCLSPSGILSPGTAAYNVLTFDQAKYGNNPAAWSLTGGIENAAYIWNQNQGKITTAAQGAALNLALWTALYNSTAVGVVDDSGRFSVSGSGFTDSIEHAYSSDLAQVNGASKSAILANYSSNPGYILRPVNATMQDLIVLPGAVPPGMRPGLAVAPEPSTIFGLLFLGVFVFGQTLAEKLKLPVLAKAR